MRGDNIVLDKSYQFSLQAVSLFRYLQTEKKEYYLSKQLLRSATSIGANIEEAMGGSSRNDFRAKLDIAHKEARETKYWLRLLRDSSMLETKTADSMIQDCEELLKLLVAILKSLKSHSPQSNC
ncbi:MAG TPA: four helix bundle protein [Sediminibacterium sp.]